MIGRLLCRLGVHCPMFAGWNFDADAHAPRSTFGYCVRNHKKWTCNWSYQLDN